MTKEWRTESQISTLAARPDAMAELLADLPVSVLVQDTVGRVLYANHQAVAAFRLTGSELAGRDLRLPWWKTIRDDGTEVPLEEMPSFKALRTGQTQQRVQLGVVRGDGVTTWLQISCVPLRQGPDQPVTGVMSSFTDVTALRELQFQNEVRRLQLASVISSIDAGILVEDESRHIVLANQPLCDLFGVPVAPEAMVGLDCTASAQETSRLFRDPDAFLARIDALVGTSDKCTAEEWHLTDGRILERDYIPILLEDRYRGHLWVYRDVTVQRMTMDQLSRKAEHDPLTGALNREGFGKALRLAFAAAQAAGQMRFVLFLDLDGFKQVNDVHGHDAGDQLLVEIAERLKAALRGRDHVARLGGDEFAVLIDAVQDPEQVAVICRRLLASVRRPATVGNVTVEVGVSIGVARFPTDGEDWSAVMIAADRAMYEAKRAGRHTFRFFAKH